MARRSTIRSGTTKSLVYAVLTIAIGGLLIFGGVSTWKNPADCGGQTMQQGDTCEVTDNGSTSDKSLSDQESSNHRDAIIMFVLGPLMMIGGGAWLTSEIRLRSARGAAPAPAGAVAGAGPFPGNGQPYPQQQYNQAAYNQGGYNQSQYPMQGQGQAPYGAQVPQQQQPLQPQQPQYGAPMPQQQAWGQQPQQMQPQPQQAWPGQAPAQPQQFQQPQQPPQGGWPEN
ncbi:hypothetical protein KDL01_28370 [Actinospica durhamensis]|uniref:Uncharacterized protein n=1 Tax=Actinospica durhamensis TaxID=1508375 RepID=A0A941ETX0_9ACTN|nr:hypothetical protein [Actinospica durhamensis]MBR7837226.1 hypothetical protein [Actinospica durhamensis]